MRPRLVGLAIAMAIVPTTVAAPSGAARSPRASDRPQGASQPGVTDTEICVGGVASKTNPTGTDFGDAFDGVKAYFEMVNSKGGVFDRKLRLVSERDDQVGSNRQEVQALLSEDDVFAALPVAVVLFTGADLLAQSGIPTFGWKINAEWGSEHGPGAPNLFAEKGSYLCFTCASPLVPWLAKKVKVDRIAVLGYSVAQAKECTEGLQASFAKYPSAKIEFVDTSLPFGFTDVSVDVAEMRERKIQLVASCMDQNGVLRLAQEMQKQGLDAIHYLVNGYSHEFMEANGRFFEGSYVLTFYTPFEVKPKPRGLKRYLEWIDKTDGNRSENSLVGWINADQFVTGLRAAGADFTREKVVDAINEMTDYTADGIIPGINWKVQHTGLPDTSCVALSKVRSGKFVPALGKPGKPFICYPSQPERLPTVTNE